MKSLLLWIILFGESSCFRQGSLFKEGKKDQARDSADLTSTQDKDRPTEAGAGLPGYLVSCATIAEAQDKLSVGCGLADKAGNRHKQGGESWQQYESKLPPDAPVEVVVEKRQAEAEVSFDAIFNYSGAPQPLLLNLVDRVTFSFTYTDADGAQHVKESKLAGPITDGSIPNCQNPPPVATGTNTSDSILGEEGGKTCRYPNPSER